MADTPSLSAAPLPAAPADVLLVSWPHPLQLSCLPVWMPMLQTVQGHPSQMPAEGFDCLVTLLQAPAQCPGVHQQSLLRAVVCPAEVLRRPWQTTFLAWMWLWVAGPLPQCCWYCCHPCHLHDCLLLRQVGASPVVVVTAAGPAVRWGHLGKLGPQGWCLLMLLHLRKVL